MAQNPLPLRTRYVASQGPAIAFPPLLVELRVTLDDEGRVGEVRPLGPARESYNFFIAKPDGGEILAFSPIMEGRRFEAANYEGAVTSAIEAVRQWTYAAPANGSITFDVKFGFFAPSKEARLLWDGLTVAGTVQVVGPRKVNYEAPVYPPIAQSARVQGTVIVEAHVEPDGHVSEARVLRSIPLLDGAARDAVVRWEFTPALVNGKPVRAPVVVITALQFTLMF